MTPRDTRTGGVLESMIVPALERGGYRVTRQYHAGSRLGGGRHMVDALAEAPDGRRYLISVKWQQVSGTAEQKVPYEVMCLVDSLRSNGYERAYVVLGGEGWKLREFYVAGGLQQYMAHPEVSIVTLETFVALANTGRL